MARRFTLCSLSVRNIFRLLLSALMILSFFPTFITAGTVKSEVEAIMYLQKYGYMNNSSPNTASLLSAQALASAVKDFQRFAGLMETGVLDNTTLTMMNMPRCGVRDRVGHSSSARRKRYALQGSKWRVNELTYTISKYPTRRLKDKPKVDAEIKKAFKVWGDATPLKFTAKSSGSRVHIDIRFEENEHGDGEPFDGPGRTLAHAFFPQYGGDAHFDDEEKWTIDQYSGTNLFRVAAHEFGHSLGLSHSDVESSLMAPFYRGYDPKFELDEDDVLGIQALYGSRKQKTTASPDTKPKVTPDLSGSPDLCQDASIDAATRTEDERTYVFKGDFYWEILQTGIADGYPRKISTDWSGLPGDLDAALTWANGKTFFFKGSNYWRFRNKKMDSDYPKEISVGFEGIPNNVDAAFVWSGNGKTYFFKGSNYWRFDSRSETPVSRRYPKLISNWEGLPNNIDAALQWSNQRTYFFKGRNYYRFSDRTFSVDSGKPAYPRSTSVWWFDCRAQAGRRHSTSSLTAGEQKPVYIGESTPSTTTEVDDYGHNAVDGSENLDVVFQQSGEDQTQSPRHEPLDGNSGTTFSICSLVLLLSALIAVFL